MNKENREVMTNVDKNGIRNHENAEVLTNTIYDPKLKKTYKKGSLLGKGGFAKCYEVEDKDSGTIYACKIVSKSQLQKPHQKEKMVTEISIHKTLNHANVVKFINHFEDRANVYIMLEICRKRTLLELHKRRKTLTDPEVRYYFYQICLACKYMHEKEIVHRDLKLGNLFLDDDLRVKVGDFGLAAKIQYPGERKKTMCGTPNYIAPEILNKSGHSYKVDVWSLGCILYTLYVGVPPFETSNVRETYSRIKKNFYTIPSKVPKPAMFLITKLLQSDPEKRLDVNQILSDPYFNAGFLPSSLPASSLTIAPRFPANLHTSFQMNESKHCADLPHIGQTPYTSEPPKPEQRSHAMRVNNSLIESFDDGDLDDKPAKGPKDCYLSLIYDILLKFISANPHKLPRICEDDAESPASAPFYWVTKWVDYSEKYGMGYQLSDRSFGVLFNDLTSMISSDDQLYMAYIDATGVETYITKDSNNPALDKKKSLLIYFFTYMNSNLLTAGADIIPGKIEDQMKRLPTVKLWRRASTHIVFLLDCGIFQANFFDDHCKFIICPHLSSVTMIDQNRRSRTFKISLLQKFGCSQYFVSRIKLILKSVEELIATIASSEDNNIVNC